MFKPRPLVQSSAVLCRYIPLFWLDRIAKCLPIHGTGEIWNMSSHNFQHSEWSLWMKSRPSTERNQSAFWLRREWRRSDVEICAGGASYPAGNSRANCYKQLIMFLNISILNIFTFQYFGFSTFVEVGGRSCTTSNYSKWLQWCGLKSLKHFKK